MRNYLKLIIAFNYLIIYLTESVLNERFLYFNTKVINN